MRSFDWFWPQTNIACTMFWWILMAQYSSFKNYIFDVTKSSDQRMNVNKNQVIWYTDVNYSQITEFIRPDLTASYVDRMCFHHFHFSFPGSLANGHENVHAIVSSWETGLEYRQKYLNVTIISWLRHEHYIYPAGLFSLMRWWFVIVIDYILSALYYHLIRE